MNHVIDEFCVCDRENDVILENFSILLDRKTTFYKIQLVHNVNSDDYTFFCKFGGKNKPQFSIIYDNKLTKQKGILKFKDKFKNKLGISYDAPDINMNQRFYGGYTIIQDV